MESRVELTYLSTLTLSKHIVILFVSGLKRGTRKKTKEEKKKERTNEKEDTARDQHACWRNSASAEQR